MILKVRGMLPTTLVVIAACHVGGIFWLKMDRVLVKIAERSEQLLQIEERLDQAQRIQAARVVDVARLRKEGLLFPGSSADNTIRSLRQSITQALPGIAFELGTQSSAPMRTSAELSLLPVTLSARVPDERLIDTISLLEGLRPGLVLTRVFARAAEARRVGQGAPVPMAEVTLSGYIMITIPGAKP